MSLAIDISSEQRELLLALLRQYIPGVEVWAYGSRVKWTARPNSDLDLVAFATPEQNRRVSELKDALAESDLAFLVDLHIWDDVPERFHETIRKEHVGLQDASSEDGEVECSVMASEWTTLPFREYLSQPLTNGIYKTKEFHGSGAKVVNMGELFAHPRLSNVPMKRVTLTEKEMSKALLRKGDLLFARRSLTAAGAGKCSIVMVADEPTTFESSIIRARPDATKADSLFFYYLFNSPIGTELMRSILRQVAVSGVTSSDLASLVVTVPPVVEQKRISEVLDVLDRSIELLNAFSEALEAIARTIFKSWFVDFDPIRAKAEGRDPEGMDAATASLFPNEFGESKDVSIPAGWIAAPLDSVATFLNGIALQKYPALAGEDSLPAIKIAQLKRGSTVSADRVSRALPPQYLIQDGDLLFSWSGSLEVDIWCGGDGALNQHLFKVTSDLHPKWFIYFWLHEHLANFREIAASKVTTMGHIQRHHLKEAIVTLPPLDNLSKLGATIAPLFERMIQSRVQARTLAELRDTLLPRLISGKLRVPEAEKLVEAVL